MNKSAKTISVNVTLDGDELMFGCDAPTARSIVDGMTRKLFKGLSREEVNEALKKVHPELFI